MSRARGKRPSYAKGRETQRPRPAPAAAELNDQAARFWRVENERLLKQSLEYPHEVSKACDLSARLIKAGHLTDAAFAADTNPGSGAGELERSRQQSERAERARRRESANNARRDDADRAALDAFTAWERLHAVELARQQLTEPRQRLAHYLSTQRPSDRRGRRLHALLRSGKLGEPTPVAK